MKKIKILTITLLIILITMIAFFGIYIQVQNRMENQVKDYEFAMDLEGSRNIRLKVNTENRTIIKDADGNIVQDADELTDEELTEKGYVKEEVPNNSEEVKNVENYKKSKEIFQKRFKELGLENYIIKLDEETGDILIEITENNITDQIVSSLATAGKFEIVDTQTQEVLMKNEDIKLSNVMYGQDDNGTSVYLNIEFTDEGTKKLEEISKKYVKVEETENSENSATEEKEQTITMKIDNEEIMTTSFDEPIETGKLQLSIGSSATDTETLNQNIAQGTNMAVVLDNGNLPVMYSVDTNEYIQSDITVNQLKIVAIVVLIIVALALIVLVIRYKTIGILGAISYVGLISTLLIVIRYANVIISIEGLFGIVITLILNYILIDRILNKIYKKDLNKIEVTEKINETYTKFFITIIPVIIMVVVFSFVQWAPISSFGMIMVWGIALIALYNSLITKTLLKAKIKE